MNKNIPNMEDFKTIAKNYAKVFKIKLGKSQQLLSKKLGFKNYQSLKVHIEKEETKLLTNKEKHIIFNSHDPINIFNCADMFSGHIIGEENSGASELLLNIMSNFTQYDNNKAFIITDKELPLKSKDTNYFDLRNKSTHLLNPFQFSNEEMKHLHSKYIKMNLDTLLIFDKYKTSYILNVLITHLKAKNQTYFNGLLIEFMTLIKEILDFNNIELSSTKEIIEVFDTDIFINNIYSSNVEIKTKIKKLFKEYKVNYRESNIQIEDLKTQMEFAIDILKKELKDIFKIFNITEEEKEQLLTPLKKESNDYFIHEMNAEDKLELFVLSLNRILGEENESFENNKTKNFFFKEVMLNIYKAYPLLNNQEDYHISILDFNYTNCPAIVNEKIKLFIKNKDNYEYLLNTTNKEKFNKINTFKLHKNNKEDTKEKLLIILMQYYIYIKNEDNIYNKKLLFIDGFYDIIQEDLELLGLLSYIIRSSRKLGAGVWFSMEDIITQKELSILPIRKMGYLSGVLENSGYKIIMSKFKKKKEYLLDYLYREEEELKNYENENVNNQSFTLISSRRTINNNA